MTKLPGIANAIRLLAILAAGALLASCGSIIDTGQDMEADLIFDLEPVSGPTPEKTGALFLQNPSHPAFLESYKIAVKPGGQEIRYLAGARWSDVAPNLVSRFLVVSLDNTSPFHILNDRESARPHQYRLVLDIRDFSVDVSTPSQPRAGIEFDATLIDAKTLEVVAARSFSRRNSASENSKAAIAEAFQRGMNEIIGDLDAWLGSMN